jgi:hypothetical protein
MLPDATTEMLSFFLGASKFERIQRASLTEDHAKRLQESALRDLLYERFDLIQFMLSVCEMIIVRHTACHRSFSRTKTNISRPVSLKRSPPISYWISYE